MSNFTKVSGRVNEIWRVSDTFEHWGRWENRCPSHLIDRMFCLPLEIAPIEETKWLTSGRTKILKEGLLEAMFLLDTGATKTIISRDIARALGLPIENRPIAPVTLSDGSSSPFVRSEIFIRIRHWHRVPCLVPCSTDGAKLVENTLGMTGVLSRYMLCIARDELHIFQRLQKPTC